MKSLILKKTLREDNFAPFAAKSSWPILRVMRLMLFNLRTPFNFQYDLLKNLLGQTTLFADRISSAGIFASNQD